MKIFDIKKSKPKKLSDDRKEKKAKKMLNKLHPMAYSILSIKSSDSRPNSWVVSAFDAINNKPHILSEKWVSSINSWTESMIDSMSLDEPDVKEGERIDLGPFKLLKIIPPKLNSEYPTSAMLLVDNRGWKWYLKSSKSNMFNEGDYIGFRATVSSHKEGITFLKRASKIITVKSD